MPEYSLNDPLTGDEIKAIILQRITDAMNRDTTLYDDIAYAGFSAKFQLDIRYIRSRTPPTMIWGAAVAGLPEGEQGVLEKTHSLEPLEYSTDQPDVARQEHNMPVPVMTQTPAGPRKAMVRIEKAKK